LTRAKSGRISFVDDCVVGGRHIVNTGLDYGLWTFDFEIIFLRFSYNYIKI
jgi:hypothetical protein